MKRAPLLVVDTLVVVSAIIGNTGSASFAVLRAIETGEVRLAVSDDWLRELVRVLEYPRIAGLINADQSKPARAFRIALGIGLMGQLHRPRRLDWPSLSDPNDGWIFDLAFESHAEFIVSRDARVIAAGQALDFEVLDPAAALGRLRVE
jgi:putative PIN family toxin of toxin-antitoxin system